MIDALIRLVDNLTKRVSRLEAHRPVFALPFVSYNMSALQPFSAAGVPWSTAQPAGERLLVLWSVNTHVLTTNDGSNYWSVFLKNQAGTTLETVTTSTYSPNTWVQTLKQASDFGGYANQASTNKIIYVETAKTGAPGDLYLTHTLLIR